MVYLATNLSLAVLEVLVHSPTIKLLHEEYVYFKLEIDDDYLLNLEISDLPPDWRDESIPLATQNIGDNWLEGNVSLGLQVPSRIIPIEKNIILNPKHSDFANIDIAGPYKFQFDSRLK